MKAKKLNNKKEFKPVKIELEIETVEELVELWKRLDIAPAVIDKEDDNLKEYVSDNSFLKLWNILEKELDLLEIKR